MPGGQNYGAAQYQNPYAPPLQTYRAAPAGNYGNRRPTNGKKGFAIASLVLGLVTLLACSCGGGGMALYVADSMDSDTFLGIAAVGMVITMFGGLLAGVLGLVFGIVSCARREEKRGMAVAGIVTAVVGLLPTIFLWLAVLVENDNSLDTEDFLKYGVRKETVDDCFAGRAFELDDGSMIYFAADGSFLWYESDADHSDNYFEGTYATRTGGDAIDYIEEELSWYDVTREEMEEYFLRNAGDDFYTEENFLHLTLETEYQVIGGQGDYNSNVRRYMGFYSEGYYDAVNMDSMNYVLFEEQ